MSTKETLPTGMEPLKRLLEQSKYEKFFMSKSDLMIFIETDKDLRTRLDAIGKVKTYVQQQATTADANSHEWQPDQASGITDINAAYRAGMWYAYRDVLKRLP